MKPVYLSLDKEVPAHAYWDQTLLDELLEGLLSSRQIVVIPGARQAELVDDISMELEQYPKVLAIITSDEENNFPVEKLYHPDMKTYVMYVNKEKHSQVDRYLPIGYPPDYKMIKESKKDLGWFFAGQINTDPRRQLIDTLRPLNGGKLLGTDGFSQGFSHEEYYGYMSRAKIVPCPGGPFSPDSFRVYEALEAGAIPIPDHPEFWDLLFPDHPFPTVDNWNKLPALINNLKDRPEVNNQCMAWWLRKKKELRWQLEADSE